jgi:GNAT superfamily N-acetyltransferase
MQNLIIRKGEQRDMAGAHALVKELAVYEKAGDEVETTVQSMEADGFGPNKIFDLFVAELDGKIVGIALYYTKYSTWKGRCIFLDDIVVTQSLRGKGIGKLLFDKVIEVAKQQNVRRLEWQVLDWNEPAIRFYEKYNAQFDGEWINCKLTDADWQRF